MNQFKKYLSDLEVFTRKIKNKFIRSIIKNINNKVIEEEFYHDKNFF